MNIYSNKLISHAHKIKELPCRVCNKRENVEFVRKIKRKSTNQFRYYFRSIETGKLRFPSRCQPCEIKIYRKSKGQESRERSKKKSVVLAVNAEKIAQKRFENLGFTVKRVDAKGPDLICSMGDNWAFTVEVKRACFTQGPNEKTWFACKVCKDRKKDHLIAYVLPNNYVYVESMKKHLKNTWKHGAKNISAVVREFGLSPPLK
jgi:hypothetical protein